MTFGGQQQLQVRENRHTERGLGSYVVSIAQEDKANTYWIYSSPDCHHPRPPPRLLTSTCTHAGSW
ncbi:hypothetical protein NC651_038194 [Populus alba x Populus x berolinensis]|nr:hypothetical protein NC651_038194 [Populus alba x Populus x berolinensis]